MKKKKKKQKKNQNILIIIKIIITDISRIKIRGAKKNRISKIRILKKGVLGEQSGKPLNLHRNLHFFGYLRPKQNTNKQTKVTKAKTQNKKQVLGEQQQQQQEQ